MAKVGDLRTLWGKHRAITTLLPYTVWQEIDGRPEVLDACLHAARAAGTLGFVWYGPSRFANTLPAKVTSRATILLSPHFPWCSLAERGDGLAQHLAAAITTVPDTKEFTQSIVDILSGDMIPTGTVSSIGLVVCGLENNANGAEWPN